MKTVLIVAVATALWGCAATVPRTDTPVEMADATTSTPGLEAEVESLLANNGNVAAPTEADTGDLKVWLTGGFESRHSRHF